MFTPKSFSIKKWSQDDQPREKLRDKGARLLSNAELLAILIGSGSRQESAVGLSKRILQSVENNLQSLSKVSLAQLMIFKGIGEAKAIKIEAAMELGRRSHESAHKVTYRYTTDPHTQLIRTTRTSSSTPHHTIQIKIHHLRALKCKSVV